MRRRLGWGQNLLQHKPHHAVRNVDALRHFALHHHGGHRLGDQPRDDLVAVVVDDLLVVVWIERHLHVEEHVLLRVCIDALDHLLRARRVRAPPS